MHFRLNSFSLHMYLLPERTRSRFRCRIFVKSQPQCSYKLGSYRKERVYITRKNYWFISWIMSGQNSILCSSFLYLFGGGSRLWRMLGITSKNLLLHQTTYQTNNSRVPDMLNRPRDRPSNRMFLFLHVTRNLCIENM